MLGDTKVQISTGNFPQIPSGMYQAKLTDVNLKQVVNQWSPDGKEVLEYQFEILTDGQTTDGKPLKGQILRSRFSKSLSNKSNLNKLVVALFGRSLTAQEVDQFHPDMLVGKEVGIMVEQKPGNQGGMFSNIVGYAPVQSPMAPMTPTQVAQATTAPVAQAQPAPASQPVQATQGTKMPWEQ